jgi:hypothetical protein
MSSVVETEVGEPVGTEKLNVCGLLPPEYVTVSVKLIDAAHGNVVASVKKNGVALVADPNADAISG